MSTSLPPTMGTTQLQQQVQQPPFGSDDPRDDLGDDDLYREDCPKATTPPAAASADTSETDEEYGRTFDSPRGATDQEHTSTSMFDYNSTPTRPPPTGPGFPPQPSGSTSTSTVSSSRAVQQPSAPTGTAISTPLAPSSYPPPPLAYSYSAPTIASTPQNIVASSTVLEMPAPIRSSINVYGIEHSFPHTVDVCPESATNRAAPVLVAGTLPSSSLPPRPSALPAPVASSYHRPSATPTLPSGPTPSRVAPSLPYGASNPTFDTTRGQVRARDGYPRRPRPAQHSILPANSSSQYMSNHQNSAHQSRNNPPQFPATTSGRPQTFDEFLVQDSLSASSKREHPKGSRLFVGNVNPERVHKKQLWDIFSPFGPLAQIAFKTAYAFVQFTNAEDASEASNKCNNVLLDNRSLKVQVTRDRNSGGGGRHGSHGNDRFHSHDSRSRDLDHDRDYRGRGDGRGRGGNDYRHHRRSASPPRDRNRTNSFSHHDRDDRDDRRRSRDYDHHRGRNRSPSPSSRNRETREAPYTSPSHLPYHVHVFVLQPVGHDFVEAVETAFAQQGFTTRVERLRDQRPDDPDITAKLWSAGIRGAVSLDQKGERNGTAGLRVFPKAPGPDGVSIRFHDFGDLALSVAAGVVKKWTGPAEEPKYRHEGQVTQNGATQYHYSGHPPPTQTTGNFVGVQPLAPQVQAAEGQQFGQYGQVAPTPGYPTGIHIPPQQLPPAYAQQLLSYWGATARPSH